MKIKKIKVAKFLSFGPQQELNDFGNFNLFIGKNGSGKSNSFDIIRGVSIDFDIIGDDSYKIPIQIPGHNGITHKNVNIFTPSLIGNYNNYLNKETGQSDVQGILEIDYEVINDINLPIQNKKIKFSDDLDGHLRYDEGDLSVFKRRVKLLEIPIGEAEFYKDLALFFGHDAKSRLPFLNFGLYYIFGLNYTFFENGTFVQAKLSNGGPVEKSTTTLPSGVLNCAKILTRYLMALNAEIVLIDEPELHLEPRMIRKLFQFLVWMNVKDKTNKTIEEENIFNIVDVVIKSHWNTHRNCSKWALVESTNETTTTYYDINFQMPQKQIFIASHSSIFLNEFLNLGENASIYKFDLVSMNFLDDDRKSFPTKKFSIPNSGLFTQVSKVERNALDILNNLGCKGSDLLQTNGVVWVEGPSDVVYIKRWLELYCIENDLPMLIQGRDYDFQMFGGTLLDSLCIIKNENNADLETEEYKKLISMFSFSRNAFVVIDSDSILNANGEIIDQSKFKNAKIYIKNQIESLKKENIDLGLWFKEGDFEIRTIESYLDAESIRLKSENNWTKKICAQKITESWGNTKKLTEFKNSLNEEIKELYNTIMRWNK